MNKVRITIDYKKKYVSKWMTFKPEDIIKFKKSVGEIFKAGRGSVNLEQENGAELMIPHSILAASVIQFEYEKSSAPVEDIEVKLG